MRIAITREVSRRIGDCELTHLTRRPIDAAVVRTQHAAYRDLLGELGCTTLQLPADDRPDSVFVEDVALVLDELAVVTRPGIESRRHEAAAIRALLQRFRNVSIVEAPGTLDGGDVIVLDRRVWVGVGGRTNDSGAGQLRDHLEPYGYTVLPVESHGCLHLKSAATAAGSGHIVANPDWIDPGVFAGLRIVEVDPAEPHAGNVLAVGETVIVAAAYPKTRRRLEQHGLRCRSVDASELAKAEGALTCCSLLFEI